MSNPQAIAARLSEAQKRAVLAMEAYSDSDTPCRNAKDLARDMGSDYDAGIAKFVAQELRKLGLAECETGLVTSDGDFYGSGWLLTQLGLAVRSILGESNEG